MSSHEKEHPNFRPADISEFQQGGLLWAVNQFVLWPLGLALSVYVDFDDDGKIRGPIELREWQYSDGHLETIEDDSEQPDFDRWQAWRETVVARIARMPQAEQEAAIARLALLEGGGERAFSERPRWRWVPDDE